MYLIAGNGGLAAEAEHFAAELTGKYHSDVYIPCIALTANSAQLTALTNDIGWENAFAHLVEVFGKAGDIFIGMTTSRAPNILKACNIARSKGLHVIQLDADSLQGKDVAEKQEYAIQYLHQLAKKIKEGEANAGLQKQKSPNNGWWWTDWLPDGATTGEFRGRRY